MASILGRSSRAVKNCPRNRWDRRENSVTLCVEADFSGRRPLGSRHPHPPPRTMTRHGPQKILVVDDDPRLRDLLPRYLGENGFTVMTADGAQTMNRLWMRERFDLLVLDLMMPGEDGLSIMRRLRVGNDTTPIIMLTAKGEDVDRIVGLEM